MASSRVLALISGALVANSAPHLASAVTGRRHLTPVAGRNSGSVPNAVWGGVNLAAGLGLLAWSRPDDDPRWGDDLLAFEAGYLVFAGWMVAGERFLRINTGDRDGPRP